jgi:hypothetical protein
MKKRIDFVLALVLTIVGTTFTMAQQSPAGGVVPPRRPQGPCDIYSAAGNPCVAAHSTTRALYATYNGSLYQVLRQSDGKTMDIGVVQATATPVPDPGGYADAAAQDKFCAGTYCWISIIYDQSPKHNNLIQAPRGGFGGPALGGFNTLPIGDMAPITSMGHKVYGVFIEPGMGKHTCRVADLHSGIFSRLHGGIHEYNRVPRSGRFVDHCRTQQGVDRGRFRH